MANEMVIVLDFGGQYNQLIARRVRECNVYCEVLPYTKSIEEIKALNPKGILFTGGPNSVYDETSPHYEKAIFDLGIPILGICYGSQLMAWTLGGEVATAPVSEYGHTDVEVDTNSVLFKGIEATTGCWMSHTDYIKQVPEGFKIIGHTPVCPVAAMENPARKLYATQFHPEVLHTKEGKKMLSNFVMDICECAGDWQMESFVENTVKELRGQIGEKHVILGLSGGVDSSVAAALLSRAIGKQLTCVFVDHGLMRKNEGDEIEETFTGKFDMNFVRIDCKESYLEKLKGVIDPEEKRKIIGTEFYRVFWDEIKKHQTDCLSYFAQGTIYPDRIESGKGKNGKSDTIKTHHNMVDQPTDVQFLGTIEPLKDLFKDEVRKVGETLGLPHELVWRQPFPGPGLGVRIIGEITAPRIAVLQEADWILRDEMAKNGYEKELAQFFCVLPGVNTVGVMGDHRTYADLIAIRAVTTDDFMTADWAKIPYEILGKVSGRITNEMKGIVNRVVYDITSKPPGTVEWE
ncbi:glutamine-hydrolyzing GMP synthase [Hespellia stercorisuis]|uniref:GMP synthase [glutamine-hydrolyzing] n=1 Tax=Hespellia stercorisuis DSM 15480 TaxID=1121950 RepID=A0A1M6X5I4_9FIRM|nr:glutamine-hydrolyzing GMP synthase [Hespellia stercorisuis]SHL01109.1 GMP synthase (glutamine-hydrolysing) [Hespellia stercorisuis DSM 15480]